MTKVDKTKKRTGVTGFINKVLNESGTAVVNIFDGVSYACKGVKEGIKKTPQITENVSSKAKALVSEGVQKIKPKIKPLKKKTLTKIRRIESKQLQEKIKKREKKIASLYYEIGKEGSKINEQKNLLEQEPIKKLITDAKGYEKEINRLKFRISELESDKTVEDVEKKKVTKEAPVRQRDQHKIARAKAVRARREKEKEIQKAVVSSQTIKQKAIRTATQIALHQGTFKTPSEQAKFETVTKDLMDTEIEIRMLAAAELSKMGNTAAVPILVEAADDNDPYLVTEVMNSLINLGDKRAIPLFKQKLNDNHYRVRIASLRGLYKLSDNDDDLNASLVRAIRDDHPEVRKSAVTFIGWKDFSEAVPPLVQCLSDEDDRVKKASISALANIRDRASVMPLIKLLGDPSLEIREKALSAIQMIVGEEVPFDIKQSNDILSLAIKDMKEWWQQKRMGVAQENEIDRLYGQAVPGESEVMDSTDSSKVDDLDKSSETSENKTDLSLDKPADLSSDIKTDPSSDKSNDLSSASVADISSDKVDTSDKPVSETSEKEADDSSLNETVDSTDSSMTKPELKKMSKTDLIALGKELGLDSSENQTKSKIIRNILDHHKK